MPGMALKAGNALCILRRMTRRKNPEDKMKPGAKVTTVRCNGYCFSSNTMCENKYRGNKPSKAGENYKFFASCGQLKCVNSVLNLCGGEAKAEELDAMCMDAANCEDMLVKATRITLMQDVRSTLGKMAPSIMKRRMIKKASKDIERASNFITNVIEAHKIDAMKRDEHNAKEI